MHGRFRRRRFEGILKGVDNGIDQDATVKFYTMGAVGEAREAYRRSEELLSGT